MHIQSYFNTALDLIQSYNGEIPLTHFLKQYFSQHKKHGSKDRKLITHLCYCFYRLGHALKALSTEQRLKIAIFLCNDNAKAWSGLFDEDWLQHWSYQLHQRIDFVKTIYKDFNPGEVFPWDNELSKSVETIPFSLSFLSQPNLFLRIRRGKEKHVLEKLQANKIAFQETHDTCLSLDNSIKVENVLEINKEVVVQDYSSQRIAEFLQLQTGNNKLQNEKVWDCCAGSGGKSILAYDVLQHAELTVSDIRPSIIQNLHKRFKAAGIYSYRSIILDLTKSVNKALPLGSEEGFSLIICDAPCTGSGTWSRTPEQLYFFDTETINEFAALQKKIVCNAIPHLKNGGYFLYITCSVFEKENEYIAEFIERQFNLQLTKQEMLIGYDKKADTMFAALFQLL